MEEDIIIFDPLGQLLELAELIEKANKQSEVETE
jgi:hypothetical protein